MWILEAHVVYHAPVCKVAITLPCRNFIQLTPVLLKVYYLNRSQPPLFAAMVDIYNTSCDATSEFKARSLRCITREYEYWTTSAKGCNIVDAVGNIHLLSRYYANWTLPRPESFKLCL